jgi:hypothetical protein
MGVLMGWLAATFLSFVTATHFATEAHASLSREAIFQVFG